MRRTGKPLKQQGVTLIELMVAIAIGMLAIYAVYRVYDGTERTKRAIIAVGDVQVSGLYATFLLEEAIQNAGSGLMFNGDALAACPDDPIGSPGRTSGSPITLSLKPLPVVINPTANADFDDIYVFAGRSSRNVVPLKVNVGSANTPFGFDKNTVLVNVNGGVCHSYLVTAAIAALPAGQPVSTPVSANIQPAAIPDGASLVDLGEPSRLRFYVDAQNTLQMELWNINSGPSTGQWVRSRTDPIVSGVMLLKAQYGIDATVTASTRGTGVTSWVAAAAPSWDMKTLQGMTHFAPAAQIRAIRLAIIVRTDEPENPNAFNQATTLTVFQNCPIGDCAAVPPFEKKFGAGTGPGGTTYRYRLYEKVVPLRNTIWNS